MPNGYNASHKFLPRLGLVLPLACLFAAAAAAAEKTPPPETVAAQLRDAALAGHDVAYNWVSELTTRFGPRPAGSAGEQQAAEWAAARLKALGFDNVHIETFPITAWVRGSESGALVAPTAQPLVVAALGELADRPPASRGTWCCSRVWRRWSPPRATR